MRFLFLTHRKFSKCCISVHFVKNTINMWAQLAPVCCAKQTEEPLLSLHTWWRAPLSSPWGDITHFTFEVLLLSTVVLLANRTGDLPHLEGASPPPSGCAVYTRSFPRLPCSMWENGLDGVRGDLAPLDYAIAPLWGARGTTAMPVSLALGTMLGFSPLRLELGSMDNSSCACPPAGLSH